MKNNRLVMVLIGMICVLLIVIAAELYFLPDVQNDVQPVSDGIRWSGNQPLETARQSSYIAIPGFYEMTFVADQKTQKVNIYNPESNQCFMYDKIILDDGSVLWESEALYPGFGFYEIELDDTIGHGVYNARLVIRCFTVADGTEVNGSTIDFKLYVK